LIFTGARLRVLGETPGPHPFSVASGFSRPRVLAPVENALAILRGSPHVRQVVTEDNLAVVVEAIERNLAQHPREG
jgi:hypothetical protein